MKRILVIDDDMRYRDVVWPHLQSCNFEVYEAASCAQGSKLLAQMEFALVVVDALLPDGDGVKIIEKLRADGCDIPVILTTAVPTDKFASQNTLQKLNIALIKVKPIDSHKFCDEVVELVRNHFATKHKNKPLALKHPENHQPQAKLTMLFPGIPAIRATAHHDDGAAKEAFLAALPNLLAGIRSVVEFFIGFPEHEAHNAHSIQSLQALVKSIESDAIKFKVKGVEHLMERIELFLSEIQFGDDVECGDSWLAIASALRNVEGHFDGLAKR